MTVRERTRKTGRNGKDHVSICFHLETNGLEDGVGLPFLVQKLLLALKSWKGMAKEWAELVLHQCLLMGKGPLGEDVAQDAEGLPASSSWKNKQILDR